MTHQLKTWTGEFDAVTEGRKTHEVRVNDRGFSVGDLLMLREWIPQGEDMKKGSYTGRSLMRKITYITPAGAWGLPDNLCVLSIPTRQ